MCHNVNSQKQLFNMSVFRQGLLSGKTAIVTGGGTGIGRAITQELVSLGWYFIISSHFRICSLNQLVLNLLDYFIIRKKVIIMIIGKHEIMHFYLSMKNYANENLLIFNYEILIQDFFQDARS